MSPAGRTWRAAWRWLPALAWMGLIFVLSAQSGLRVSDDADVDRPLRTLAHVVTYAVLAALLLFAITGRGRPSMVGALAALSLALLYGVSDEVHQSFVPERTGQVEDVIVDAIGAGIGVVAAWLILARRRRE